MKCTQCDFICVGKNRLDRHMLRHQERKFVCNICNLQLSTAATLVSHKSNISIFLKLNFAITLRNLVNSRIRFIHFTEIHNRTEADRIFECSICFKKFFTAKSSQAHMSKFHTTKRKHF